MSYSGSISSLTLSLLLGINLAACAKNTADDRESDGENLPPEAESGLDSTSDSENAADEDSDDGNDSENESDSPSSDNDGPDGLEDTGNDNGAEGDSENNSSGEDSDGDDDDSGMDSDGGGTEGETGSDDEGESGESGETGSGDGGDGDDGSEAAMLFMIVEPHDQIVEVDLNTPTSFPYTVTGYFSDGSSSITTDDVEWSTSNAEYGTMVDANLEVPGLDTAAVASNIITASHNGVEATARVTVAAYDHANDFFFLLPYEDSAGNQEKPLDFSTDVQAMDVFFNMDTTGSMGGEINNLRSSLNQIITNITANVEDTQFGVGRYDDFPVGSYGGGSDQPFLLHQAITGSTDDVTAAVNALSLHGGGDYPESLHESLYQIATGEGLAGPAPTVVAANNDGIGGVGFREGTIPIVVYITDAITHTVGGSCGNDYASPVMEVAHSRDQTVAALNEICARTVAIATENHNEGNACGTVGDGNDLATATQTRIHPDAWDAGGRPAGCAAGKCCTGFNGASIEPDGDGMCPLVYRASGDGSGVGTSVEQGIQMVAQYTPFSVSVEIIGKGESESGVALPAGKTTADFIKSVTPNRAGAPPLPGLPDPVIDGDHFDNVTPGTDVFFDVEVFNDVVPSQTEPQLFSAQISVKAGDCSVNLDTRQVLILVPAKSQ